MKNLLLASFLVLLIGYGKSQNISASFVDIDGTATLVPIPNGSTHDLTTTVTVVSSSKIRFYNNGSANATYSVRRKIITLESTGKTYFCFGMSCFDHLTDTPPTSADYVTLTPGGSNQGFVIDLDDSLPNSGYSLVRYKLYDVNNANDTLAFYARYNTNLSGISYNNQTLESVSELYPNPANSNVSINVNLKHEGEVKINIHNTLGSVIYSGTQKCNPGKNKVSLDCSNYNAGMYFITVMSGDSKITKRLIVR